MPLVCISSVSGETLDLELQASDTIVYAKRAVASTWGIPCSCQKLLSDAQVLEEDAIIERCMPPISASDSSTAASSTSEPSRSSLDLTVVVSLDVVRTNINSNDACADVRAAKRVFALQELGILGLKGGQAGIALVVNCLEEKDERVCGAAIEALSKIAVKGNPNIAAALLSKLKHKRCNVKRVALEFLGQLAEVGDHTVITEICFCLEQHVISSEVTTAAIETLGTLALQGDQEFIVTSLTKFLSHKSKLVRKVAVQALTKLSERGVVIDITGVSACLADTQPEVRIATLKAIAKISPKGSQDALAAVSKCFADPESSVRLAALCAMAEVGDKGDANAFAYSRLLGAFKRRSINGGGTSTSSEGEFGTPSTIGGITGASDAQSEASSSAPSCAVNRQSQRDDDKLFSRECSSSFCNRRETGTPNKCLMQ